jgi:hypothetical protein
MAVQLNPESTVDRHKLDEMIDKVFQSTPRQQTPPVIHPSSLPPLEPMPEEPGWDEHLRTRLNKLQPIHVVLGTAVLAMLFVAILLLLHPAGNTKTHGQAHAMQPPHSVPFTPTPAPANPPAGANTREKTPATPPENTMTPPSPDAVEGAGASHFPTSAVRRPVSPAVTPPATPPVPHQPAEHSSSGAQVPPFQPESAAAVAMTPEELERQQNALKTALEAMLGQLKLTARLDNVWLDPRNGSVVLDYTLPPQLGPTETKQGLLYIGFHLVWTAQAQSSALKMFTLRGFASTTVDRPPTLALLTEITLIQAVASLKISDYHSSLQYLTNPWWRPDLATLPL